jgi:hypothetical protein
MLPLRNMAADQHLSPANPSQDAVDAVVKAVLGDIIARGQAAMLAKHCHDMKMCELVTEAATRLAGQIATQWYHFNVCADLRDKAATVELQRRAATVKKIG